MLLGALAGGCEAAGGPGAAPAAGPPAEEDVWAIRCITLQGRDQQARAQVYAEALRRVSGLKPALVQVLTDEDGTTVYYGRYRRKYGTEAGEAAYRPDPRPDLDTIRTLRFRDEDVWPFILASMDVLPTFRSAHPEWDLEDAEGTWALHVAVFYNTEGLRSRRSAAEEYCRLLRAEGESAWFHHGAVNSSVYIGPFPEGAVAEFRRENPLAGTVRASRRIVDPDMLAAQKRFPHSLQNGHKVYDVVRDPATGKVVQRIPTPSFPVMIPKALRARQQLGQR